MLISWQSRQTRKFWLLDGHHLTPICFDYIIIKNNRLFWFGYHRLWCDNSYTWKRKVFKLTQDINFMILFVVKSADIREDHNISMPLTLTTVGIYRHLPGYLVPERKVGILVCWVEPDRKCWVSYLNPTYENQASCESWSKGRNPTNRISGVFVQPLIIHYSFVVRHSKRGGNKFGIWVIVFWDLPFD